MTGPTELKRVAVFFDGDTLQQKQLLFRLDWAKVPSSPINGEPNDVITLTYSIIETFRDGQSSMRRLLDYLDAHGFRMIIHDADVADDGSIRRARNCMLVALTAAMMTAARTAHEVVLWSGDSALMPAVAAMQAAGIRVTVVYPDKGCASALRRQADRFIDLTACRPDLELVSKVPA